MSKIEDALRKARRELQSKPRTRPDGASADETARLKVIKEGYRKYESSSATGEHPRTQPGRELVRIEETTTFTNDDLAARRIIHGGMKQEDVAKGFRNLRTTIIRKSDKRNCIILVTAACHGGGASFVSINLGAAFALDETRTAAVVSCDFADQAFYLDVLPKDSLGLTDCIYKEGVSIDQIVQKTGIARLRVVPPGQSVESGGEFFSHDKVQKLIRKLKKDHPERFVILDCPPVLEAADTQTLLDVCDMCLLVVPYGKVMENDVKRAVESIPKDKFLGIVFNDGPKRKPVSG